jgi:hypothetical protein
MDADRARLGPVLSVTGGALLAVSVFLPWYSLTITPAGATYAEQAMRGAATQYGNAELQDVAATVGAQFSALAGHQVGTVSAHDALKTLSVVLLLLAAASFAGALVWLSELDAPIKVDGRQIAAVGGAATLFVLYRMAEHPGPSVAMFSLSLSWGIWLALVSALTILGGGLLGRGEQQRL